MVIRDTSGAAFLSFKTLKKQCVLHPAWSSETGGWTSREGIHFDMNIEISAFLEV